MKKHIIALGMLGAVCGSANAQSAVQIYGLFDLGVVVERGGPDGSVTKLTNGVINGSRLGFRGREDLGGGLAAVFVIENGFNGDTGTLGQGGLIFGRQALVGLESPWGSLKLGRQYTPYDALLATIDPFGVGYAGRINNVFSFNYIGRVNNSIQYQTPTIAGFTGTLLHGFGEVPGDSGAGRYAGVGLAYQNGPITVRLSHQDSNNATDTGSVKNTGIGGIYDFGVVKAHLAFGMNKTDAGGVDLLDDRDVMVGATVPVGIGRFMVSYVRKEDKLPAGNDASQLGIGYLHPLSTRTSLYTSVAKIRNKRAAAYTVGSAIENGSGDKAFNFGVRHTF